MIKIDKKNLVFHLQTKDTSYIFGVNKKTKLLETLYYGSKIKHNNDLQKLANHFPRPFSNWFNDYETESQNNNYLEFSTLGFSDFRDSSIEIDLGGDTLTHFEYIKYEIKEYNENSLSGLPFAHSCKKTLSIYLLDKVKNIEIELRYTPTFGSNIILRNNILKNKSQKKLIIKKIYSSSFDIPNRNYEIITLNNAWSRENQLSKHKITNGQFSIYSRGGNSTIQHQPFIAMKEENGNFNNNIYGLSLIYSSNWKINFEVNQYDIVRLTAGINPDTFEWELLKNEVFETPQVALTFSSKGTNDMSQNFHSFIRDNISPKYWSYRKRPIIINNWEATYFDFNEQKILEIAKQARKVGIELFCLDDGWFGQRNNDKTSLGDWFVNKNKLPNGLIGLSNKLNKEGLKFGLWIEPEMISEKSELFKKHPEWVINNNKYPIIKGRHQLILDITKKSVRDFIYKTICNIIDSSNIEYIKWDMNRPFSHSPYKGFEHKYILGFYEVLEKLTSKYPKILWEGCSAGGGRFDMGVLKYYPQIWTSDNTDAFERVKIQYGASFIYPMNVLSNHVSAIPNHQVGRSTPLSSRQNVSNFGIMGYEIDLTKIGSKEIQIIKNHINIYKKIRKIIMSAKFYRLISPHDNNISSWQIVSKNKKRIIVLMFNSINKPNQSIKSLRLVDVDKDAEYFEILSKKIFSSYDLANIGINPTEKMLSGDFESQFLILEKSIKKVSYFLHSQIK